MQRKRRWPVVLLGVTLTLATTLAATYVYIQRKTAPTASAHIGAGGGTVEKFGIKATVPSGLLAKPTELRLTEPKPMNMHVAPLGAASVTFGVSFADGSQPSKEKPLALEVPLRGALLPAGASPADALFYHKLPNNGGYSLYPFTIQGNVLRADLVHLSEWVVAFFGPEEAERMFGVRPSQPDKNTCGRTTKLMDGTKVELVAKNNNGHVNPCLKVEGDSVRLHVKNNTDYMWPVRVHNGSYGPPNGSAEQKLVMLTAGATHPQKVTNYLAIGQELIVKLGSVSKPSSVTLEVGFHTWMIETGIRTIKAAVALYFGLKNEDAERWVGAILENGDAVMNCLVTGFSKLEGKNLFDTLKAVPDVVINDCGEIIEGVAETVIGATLDAFMPLKRVIAHGSAAWMAIEQAYKLAVAVFNSFNGNVELTVKRAAPPKPPCATLTDFRKAIRELAAVTEVRNIKCSDGWATGGVSTAEFAGPLDATLNLIHYRNGKWVHIRIMNEPIFYGTPENDKLCAELPADFRKSLCMRI